MIMTNTQPTDADTDLLTSRLYAGQIGSGKSVTIGRDIHALLDAAREYRVIDVSIAAWYDWQALADEYETEYEIADLGDEPSVLRDALRETPYLRINAEGGKTDDGDYVYVSDRRVRYAVERALVAAIDCEYPTVIVLDNRRPALESGYLANAVKSCQSHGVSLWVADHDPFADGLAEKWVGAGGEIVLTSSFAPPREQKLQLSDAEEEYVAKVAHEEIGVNQILVGEPGEWRRETVELEERYK